MTAPDRRTTIEDPEFAGSLMAAIERLRLAEGELEHQNAELVALAAALEAERLRYRQLFDRAPLAHLTTDRSGRIDEANEAAGRMLQVEPRFLCGKPLAAFVDAEDVRRFRTWLLHPNEHDHPVFRMRRRGGVPLDVEVHTFQDDDSTSWVLRDVTEQLHAEQQLWNLNRELERRAAEQAGEIAAVYEQLPIGVGLVHAGDDGPPRLNPRGREILRDAFPFDDLVARAFTGESTSGVVAVDDRVVEAHAAPLRRTDGKSIGAVVTFDDITDRERIERADREFVSNASHQLRTPITAIASAVAALKAGAADDPVERERFLDHVETEADRLARIIDAMLVLSRAQRRSLNAPLTLVRLRPVLERLVTATAPAPGVAVSLDCADTIAVIAHAALLEEALASVLANAVEHTTSGTISVAADDDGDHVAIEVADTGPGIPPEIRDRVFERFFGSNPTRRSAGLGLAIAAAAVHACRGTIELASEPRDGTRVRIALPRAALLDS